MALHFPIPQGCFVPSLVKISPVVLEKNWKIGKVYRQTDGQTGAQKSSLELSAQVSLKTKKHKHF